MEGGEAGRAAEAAGIGPAAAGPDAGRVEGERAEQPVDVVRHPRLGCAGILIGGDEPGTDRLHHPELLVGEPGRH